MSHDVKVDCKNIWKLYGADAASLLAGGAEPDDAVLKQAGVIGAVRGVDVQIRNGEIFVIMGLSGSGKSTLVRCMSRLIEPTAGEIKFDDQQLLTMSEKELIDLRRKQVGMVFQNFALLPHLTVLQNVAFPLDVQGVDRATREERARSMIETVGLQGREDYLPRQLSGGQQQRVGIARSLVGDPDIWFLDEPFSALDPLIRRGMQDEFLSLQSKLKKTIVFITHDFDEAIRLADRIAVMKDGKIEQTATPEELILNPASDYVAEFTRHISREKVMRLKSIMSSDQISAKFAGDLNENILVSKVSRQIVNSKHPFRVVSDDGNAVGSVDRDTCLEFLIGSSES